MIPKAIQMDLRQITLLLIFFIFYVIIGGVVFMFLEAPHEIEIKQRMKDSAAEFRESLKSLELTPYEKANMSAIINTFLLEQNMPSLDDPPEDFTISWDFFNSFFFAITVVTTIGYGHLSPSTSFGRLFCLVYALFGIPMTGILLGAIGDRFSRCFLDKIHKVRRRSIKHLSTKLMVVKHGLIFFIPWFTVFIVIPSMIFFYTEKWTFLECFYYCFITLSTIGFGDFVAGQFQNNWVWLYKIVVVLWIIFGLAYLSMILNFISQGLRSHHLSNVVHSIRRISGPPLHSFKHHGFRHNRNKPGLSRQQSYPFPYPNGKGGYDTPTLGSVTPTTQPPSPLVISETSSFQYDSTTSSRMPSPKKAKLSNLFGSFKNNKKEVAKSGSKETKPEKVSSIECPVEQNNLNKIRVIVTDANDFSHQSSLSSTSLSVPNSGHGSPLPQTREALKESRNAFFHVLNSDLFPVTPV